MAITATCARCFVAGALLLGFRSVPANAATPEEGRRAYDAGHFTDAMGIWAELSRLGNAEAELGLGLLYDLGNGTQQNSQTAFLWYNAAAEAGLPAAEFNVAAMYDSGRGVAQSNQNAALWYAKAAAHGHHRAQFALAQLYEHGEGVPQNPDLATAWLRDAADGGLPAAAVRLQALARSPNTRPSGPLTAVALVSPVRNATLALTGANLAVELVWTATLQPQPVHYEVQVRQLDGPTLRTIYTASMAHSATIVPMAASSNFYVWNVDTVGQDGTHVPGDWNWFSIEAEARSDQSMASAHGTAPAKD